MKFRTPVVVEPGVIGRYRVITDPKNAIDVLTGRWPECDSTQYQKAIEMCRQAIEGNIPPHLARTSVVAAARAAGVLITKEESERYTLGSVDLATEVPLQE